MTGAESTALLQAIWTDERRLSGCGLDELEILAGLHPEDMPAGLEHACSVLGPMARVVGTLKAFEQLVETLMEGLDGAG